MGLGSKLKRWTGSTVKAVGQAGEDVGRAARDAAPAAAAYAANPLIAQDIMGAALGGALSRGADPRTALQAPTAAVTGGYKTQDYMDLAAFNAALVAGAATGGATSALMYSSPAAVGIAAPLGTVAGSVGGALAAGAGTYALAQTGANAIGGNTFAPSGSGETPPSPDTMEANDPNTAQQFQRLRKAARALGRYGTIKRGTTGMLGDAGGLVGTEMALGA